MRCVYITAISLLFLLSSCKKPQAFEYRDFKNFRVESFGFDKSAVVLDLVYFNPNGFGVNLKHIDCDIYLDKNYLGQFVLDTTMHIPGKAEFVLPAKMNVDMKNLYKNALNTIFSTEILVEVNGHVKAGKGGIFINFPFNYSKRQKIALY
jgi:LEA14-like dessication related protein